jgi:hypothetical protein
MRVLLVLCVVAAALARRVRVADCEAGAWSDWSPCNVTCGEGQQMRTRTVHVAPNSVSRSEHCPPLLEWRVCHNPECPLDCVLSEWSPWTSCSAKCGWGLQRRGRDVRVYPRGEGAKCGAVLEERECNLGECAVDCVVSPWSVWGRCLDGKVSKKREERKKKNLFLNCRLLALVRLLPLLPRAVFLVRSWRRAELARGTTATTGMSCRPRKGENKAKSRKMWMMMIW